MIQKIVAGSLDCSLLPLINVYPSIALAKFGLTHGATAVVSGLYITKTIRHEILHYISMKNVDGKIKVGIKSGL